MQRGTKYQELSLVTVQSITNQGSKMLTIAVHLLAVVVYVTFRSSCPDIATVLHALQTLQDNNINIRHLVAWSTNHCQHP